MRFRCGPQNRGAALRCEVQRKNCGALRSAPAALRCVPFCRAGHPPLPNPPRKAVALRWRVLAAGALIGRSRLRARRFARLLRSRPPWAGARSGRRLLAGPSGLCRRAAARRRIAPPACALAALGSGLRPAPPLAPPLSARCSRPAARGASRASVVGPAFGDLPALRAGPARGFLAGKSKSNGHPPPRLPRGPAPHVEGRCASLAVQGPARTEKERANSFPLEAGGGGRNSPEKNKSHPCRRLSRAHEIPAPPEKQSTRKPQDEAAAIAATHNTPKNRPQQTFHRSPRRRRRGPRRPPLTPFQNPPPPTLPHTATHF